MAAPSDESIDLTSPKFDPLKALYSDSVVVPRLDIDQLNNLAEYETKIMQIKGPLRPAKPSILASRGTREIPAGKSMSRSYDHRKDDQDLLTFVKRREKRNVLTRMAVQEQGPFSLLYRCVTEYCKVKVWTRSYKHVRGICTGYIIAYDKHWNLAMCDVDEVYICPMKRQIKCKKKKKYEPSAKGVPEEEAVKDVSGHDSRKERDLSGTRNDSENKDDTEVENRLDDDVDDDGVENLEHRLELLKMQLEKLSSGESEEGETEEENDDDSSLKGQSSEAEKMDQSGRKLPKQTDSHADELGDREKAKHSHRKSKHRHHHHKDSKGDDFVEDRAEKSHDKSHRHKVQTSSANPGGGDTKERSGSRHEKIKTDSEKYRKEVDVRSERKRDEKDSKRESSKKEYSKEEVKRDSKKSSSKTSHDKYGSEGERARDTKASCSSRDIKRSGDKTKINSGDKNVADKEKDDPKDAGDASSAGLLIGGRKARNVKKRHVNQLFIRGDNVVMVSIIE